MNVHILRNRGICIFFLLVWVLLTSAGLGEAKPSLAGGELRILDQDGKSTGVCPLKHTDIEADIIGFVSRVHVRQIFHNPLDTKIEAVYVFPLPHNAAVETLVMTVGDQRIVSQIKPRREARTLYKAAQAAGHVASLLDQERPNIFTQSVTNIEPGAQVVIELSYVETLSSQDGVFEFVFPMVVRPRYMPGSPIGAQGSGWAKDTPQVPDASRISPPVARPGTRAGHDISVTIHIDAGMELLDLESNLHEVNVERIGPGRATVTLKSKAEIPNKDFILRYRTAADAIGDALLVYTDERGTFFTLVLQPPQRVLPGQILPKEMIFVIDRSGSMWGFPIEKAKEITRFAIEQMNPSDTFNLLSFSDDPKRCFTKPVPNTPQNRAIALKCLADLYGSGETMMLPAIREALEEPPDPQRVRIVALMTDGYVGNDFAIIDTVQKHASTARVFAFGIGNAVNRFLLDEMAHAGRGAVEYVTLKSQADGAARRFQERIHAPVLTDIAIDWGTLPVADIYPKLIPDLFSSQPIMIHGRLTDLVEGPIVLRGNTAAGPFERRIHMRPSTELSQHEALASLWARAKVKDLMRQDYAALQRSTFPEAIQNEITTLGVTFHLVTQFTSLVAVEEMTVTVGGEPMTIAVPVEIPEGVSYEGVFGPTTMAFPTLPSWLPGIPSGSGGSPWRSRGFSSSPGLSLSPPPTLPLPQTPSFSGRPSFSSPPSSSPISPPSLGPGSVGGGMVGLSLPPHSSLRFGSHEKYTEHARGQVTWTKLADPLRGLGEKVAKAGQDGTLTLDKLRVIDYRVDVMVYLRDTSAQTINTLKQLGFVQTGESKVARLLIGTIDVRELEKLATLDAVIRVTPVNS